MKPTNTNFCLLSSLVISFLLFSSNFHVESQTNSLICSGVCDLAWSPTDGNLIAAVNQFGLWLYDIEEADENSPTLYPLENTTSLDFSPDGNSIAVTACELSNTEDDSCNGIISIFDLEGETWSDIAKYDYRIDNVQFSPDGKAVAIVQDKNNEWGLQVINLSTHDTLTFVDSILTNLITTYDFSPDSDYLVINNGTDVMNADDFNGVSVWDVNTATLIINTEENLFREDVIFTSDSSIIFVESDARVSVWDYVENSTQQSYTISDTINDPLNEFNLVETPPILLGSLLDDWHPRDRTLYVWDLQTGNEIYSIDIPFDNWHDILEINLSGEYFVATSSEDEDKIADVWGIMSSEHYQIAFAN